MQTTSIPRPGSRIGCVLLAGAFLALPSAGRAAGRQEDLRVTPPERWAPVKAYGLDLQLGGMRQQGNVDQANVHTGLNATTAFQERHQVFAEWASDYTSVGGRQILNKYRGSLLYAYAVLPHLNLFAQTTHGHNSAILLDYRTQNGLPGVCVHGFFKPYLSTFLASTALVTEYESYRNGDNRTNMRASNRLNFAGPISEYATYGSDFIYEPKLSRIGDYRLLWEGTLQFKLTPERLSFRVTLSDEYESRPVVPGVRRNDFGTTYAVVVHLWK